MCNGKASHLFSQFFICHEGLYDITDKDNLLSFRTKLNHIFLQAMRQLHSKRDDELCKSPKYEFWYTHSIFKF